VLSASPALSRALRKVTGLETYITRCLHRVVIGDSPVLVQIWLLLQVMTLGIGIPVLALEYYWVILLAMSMRYPSNLAKKEVKLARYPLVSILIATYNEKFVIERSLEAVKQLNYPKERIQVVVADDSNDQTTTIVDRKVEDLSHSGIRALVSRRPTREYFKCGALNRAMDYVDGEYVLLLDADSLVSPDVLTKGIEALESHPRTAFVSYRYGHYNRDYNMVTKLFALTQDIGDTISKMGAYQIDAPFSYQGGQTLVRTKDLREVGMWSNQRIADDADVSIKMYLAGKRGIYLSNVKIMSEDPSTLEAWKKQVARTSQGWWRCIANYWRAIAAAPGISAKKKVGLILMLMAPFSSLSWIIVTFLSTFTVVFNLVPPTYSIFNSPVYVAIVTVPFVISLASGAWALKVQGLMTARNVILIPMLGYASGGMLVLGSIGFFYGVFDRVGFFLYRTPKSGSIEEMTKTSYFQHLRNDRNSIVEAALGVAGIVFAWLVFIHGVWFLALSMAGFGIFTLKSMNLTKHLALRRPRLSVRSGPTQGRTPSPMSASVSLIPLSAFNRGTVIY
jgi:cellulose synthase/poly-beta-1,6-N-acetylglucosamine synthase-like glycosyltransferase